MGVIYFITSPTGKRYIGQTRDLKRRISDYRFKTKKRNTPILNSVNKYGWGTHKMYVIEEVPDERLSEREIFWIQVMMTYRINHENGLNLTLGGEGHRGTWMHDIERRKRQSERCKGSGGNFYGKKHTEEARKKISEMTSLRNRLKNIKVPPHGQEKSRLATIKRCYAYDVNGKFICEFSSRTDAAKYFGITRGQVMGSIINERFAHGKYFFCNSYKGDTYHEIPSVTIQNKKRSVLYFIEGAVRRFACPRDAAVETGVPETSITRAARLYNMKPLRSGHVFIYEDLYNKK